MYYRLPVKLERTRYCSVFSIVSQYMFELQLITHHKHVLSILSFNSPGTLYIVQLEGLIASVSNYL